MTKTVPMELPKLPKALSGISGLDAVTGGGLPRNRLTLVCGGAGCGKTLFALEFIVRGATEFGEPGVVVSFDETVDDLAQNVASLGFDLPSLIADRKLAVVHIVLDPQEQVSGNFDLAKRLALDTLEAMFGTNLGEGILRAEIQRLFRWIRDRGVTAVVTGERGRDQLTRWGLEENITDCVISLDHRVDDQVTTRRLRVVKYRGTLHGTNEYPFIIAANGISVLPVTSITLKHTVSTERISSGVPRLDTMLGGQGFFKGSSALISGTAGTGKTTLAGQFVKSACERGERCLFFAFEEAPAQIMRNLMSVGIDLEAHEAAGLLILEANRPTATGLEAHLLQMHNAVETVNPSIVVVDPINSFVSGGNTLEVKALLVRLIDHLKMRGITALLTSLTTGGAQLETTDTEVSSLIDTWLILRDIETYGERNRGLMVLKSRGMAHSNQIREFKLSDEGIVLTDVFVGSDGVAMGTRRVAREAEEADARRRRAHEIERLGKALAEQERAFEEQARALHVAHDNKREAIKRAMDELMETEVSLGRNRSALAQSRFADHPEL